MPRPRLVFPPDAILDAYEKSGSLRGASKNVGASRWVIEKRLEEAGIAIRSRQEAIDLIRYLKSEERPLKEERTVEQWGDTEIVRITRRPYRECGWPGCDLEADVHSGVCECHFQAIPQFARQCAWPECWQEPMSGALCYRHRKKVEGMTE